MILINLLLLGQAFAATITVEPDRNPVVAGEEFTLTFSMTEQPAGNPDFSPLYRDFEVTSTSTSQNIQLINGQATRQYAWRLELFPKGKGVLQVPPIRFGNDTSPIINIMVSENPELADGQDGVMVELEVETQNPYVQQQIIIVQRLLHSVELSRSGANMTHPDIIEGKGQIMQLGGVTNKTELRKGVRYRIAERRYAVFAQNSGQLTIGRTVFQGIKQDGKRRRDPFGMSGRRIRRFSKPLTLEVAGQPEAVTAKQWLPANSLSINAYWQTPPESFQTGEPVTLTLAVMADGLLAEQLPELTIQPPKGLKSYSNQPDLNNNNRSNSLVGTRQEKWILIGTAPGEYQLPEISLQWWNLQTGQEEVAKVPASLITVTGAVPAQEQAENSLPPESTAVPGEAGGIIAEEKNQELIATESDDLAPEAVTEQQVKATKAQRNRLWMLVVGCFLLLIGAIFALVTYSRRRRSTSLGQMAHKRRVDTTRVNALRLLQAACQENNAQKSYDALSDWVRLDLQLSPPTLARLRAEADPSLREALDELSAVLYSENTTAWNGASLWAALQQQFAKPKAVKVEEELLSLYPDSDEGHQSQSMVKDDFLVK